MISRPITIVELDMDRCTRTYGSAPCTASLAASRSCFNTRATCQDAANFLSAVQMYRLSDMGIGLPPEVEAIPCIESVSIASTKLTPMKGLGQRASISITLRDFAHHDRGFDPYVASRTYSAEDQGTFWGKFRARHKYYQGRKLRIRTGEISTPWNWSSFDDRTYIIDRITGPDASGKVTITAKDVLKLADGDRAQCPRASSSTLSADITAVATSITLLPAGIGTSEYAVREQTVGSGYVRIGSEIMSYTRSGDVLTVVRAQQGTVAATHTAGDSVQLCAAWSAVNVATVIKQLLGPLYANVDAANSGTSYLSDASWADEAIGNLGAYPVTAIISKPEGIDTLISELSEQCMALVWWDEVAALIKIRGIAPQLTAASFTDDDSLIAGTVQAADDPAGRVSQVWFFYGLIDASGDIKASNFRNLYVQADLDAEDADQYGEQRIKTIYSRWLSSAAPVIKTAGRTLIFLRDNPRTAKFSLDRKDRALDVADSATLVTKAFQDETGAPLPLCMIVTERAEKQGRVEYSAVNMGFYGRYLRIAPGGSNASGTHVPSTETATIASYSTATSEEKRKYGYVLAGGSNTSGTHVPASSSSSFSDRGEPYKIA